MAFVTGVARDGGGLLAHLGKPDMNIAVLVGIVVFLLAGVLASLTAYKARNF